MKWNLTLIFCSIFLSVTGCSIVRQPSPEEYESVRQNQKAIVLFRLTGSRDGKEVHVLLDSIGSYPNFVFLSFGLANLNANEPLKVISVRGRAPFRSSYAYFSPSSEIAETGWVPSSWNPGRIISA